MIRKIAIGCDHVGYELKPVIVEHLKARGIDVVDYGTDDTERTDYPIYGRSVAEAVAEKNVDGGILICGTGVGISIVANKIKGIRAVVCSEPYSAKLSKEHNDTNILALGARVVGSGMAEMIVDAWLDAQFEGGRHKARVSMIESVN